MWELLGTSFPPSIFQRERRSQSDQSHTPHLPIWTTLFKNAYGLLHRYKSDRGEIWHDYSSSEYASTNSVGFVI